MTVASLCVVWSSRIRQWAFQVYPGALCGYLSLHRHSHPRSHHPYRSTVFSTLDLPLWYDRHHWFSGSALLQTLAPLEASFSVTALLSASPGHLGWWPWYAWPARVWQQFTCKWLRCFGASVVAIVFVVGTECAGLCIRERKHRWCPPLEEDWCLIC